MKRYPLVPLTLEPGPIYQVPLIERFIPANKSLDTTMSRVERWLNTMVVGAWMTRKGDNFEITNRAGGQVIEYELSKPEQADIQPLPEAVWNYIQELTKIIDEQGAPTAALNQIPQGIRSGVAIESLKATEYANLRIPTKQLRVFVKEITKRMIDIAAYNLVTPETMEILDENNKPTYFDIVGYAGKEARTKIKQELPKDTVVIDPDTIVDIQIESGMGFTEQGRREVMLQINEYILKLAEAGIIPREAANVGVKELLKTFAFGSTQEFMQAVENGFIDNMDEEQIMRMKVAMAETLKDSGIPDAVGKVAENVGDSDQRIQEDKIATVEAIKDVADATEVKKTA